jgi:hypothetical protein
MIRETSLSDKGVDFIKKCAHVEHNTRYSVPVNTRHNVRARDSASCYKISMKDEWYNRLIELIERDSRSYRQLSVDAALGQNFVQQFIKNKKDPRSSQLEKLFAQLGPGSDIYVFTGLWLKPQDVQFLQAASRLDSDGRKTAMRVLIEQKPAPKQLPAPPEKAPSK